MLRLSLLAALLAATFVLSGCAAQECDFHSQCGDGFYCLRGTCRQDCRADFDCEAGQSCSEIGQCGVPVDGGPRPDGGPVDGGTLDATTPPRDAGVDSGTDTGPPDPDAGPRDAGPPDAGPPDAGPPVGAGQYLDRCINGVDCASGRCVDDVGGTRMCTISCTAHSECASEHVCAAGSCVHDDTGAICSTPASCALGICLMLATTPSGHCSRECGSAADCPSGFACADAGGTRFCADIERGCSVPEQCVTGLCLSAQGCTAECRTAADCPRRFDGSPPYMCAIAFGSASPICVPPEDIFGGDPIGASCPPTGFNTCRSGGCNPVETTGPMCTQVCTQEGGCGPGLGCRPEIDVEGVTLYCSRAGTRAIGSSCATARECESGLCDTAGYCTRLCTDDALCPSDMSCAAVPGYPLALCRR